MDSLLADYASSSSSSSSSSDDEDTAAAEVSEPAAKRAKQAESPAPAPTLPPPELDDLPGVSEPEPDRVRQFEHVDGQFATHVYLPVTLGASLQGDVDRHVASLQAASNGGSGVHPVGRTEYHVSLSRTCVLVQPQLNAFVEALRVALRGCQHVQVRLEPGRNAGLCQLANDSHTRFFEALELHQGSAAHAGICRMIDAVDSVCKRFEQPTFYAERRAHFSIAWSLGEIRRQSGSPAQLGVHELCLESVACKIGERTTLIKLGRGG